MERAAAAMTTTNIFVSNNINYLFATPRRRNLQPSRHAMFMFVINLLVACIQVKYQGNDAISPFDSSPKTMLVALASVFAYCMAFDVWLRISSPHHHPLIISPSFPTYNSLKKYFLYICMVIFGTMSVGSMTSILFPVTDQSMGPIMLLFSFLAAILLISMCGLLIGSPIQAILEWLKNKPWVAIGVLMVRFCDLLHQGRRRRGLVLVQQHQIDLAEYGFADHVIVQIPD